MVEFQKNLEEIVQAPDELARSDQRLIQEREVADDGSESPAARPESP